MISKRVERMAFLPPTGRGRVLITSQNPNWPPGQMLDVPVLESRVAADFLVSRSGDADRQSALELAVELGWLPLALEQAAAYMQATGDRLTRYLATFMRRRADMLARGEPTSYDKTVATTWVLAFERVQQANPEAIGLLRLLACCASEAIPLELLLQPRPGIGEQLGPLVAPTLASLLGDPLIVSDAVTALRRYSLVSAPVDGLVTVHRLVQAVTADQMPADMAGQWRQAAAALIEAAIPDDTGPPETWAVCEALLPHAQTALANESAGMARLANYLGESGSYAAALELQQRVLEARERVLGPDHPQTLAARANLAAWTGMAGDAAGARDQYARVLPLFQRVLGPEHRQTLTARGNLARFTGEAGDAAGARDQFARVLPLFERVLGPEHPDTLTTRHELARFTGDAAGARDQFAELLPIIGRVDRGASISLERHRGVDPNMADVRGTPRALPDQPVRTIDPEIARLAHMVVDELIARLAAEPAVPATSLLDNLAGQLEQAATLRRLNVVRRIPASGSAIPQVATPRRAGSQRASRK